MREFSEIEVIDSGLDDFSRLIEEHFLTFDFNDNNLKRVVGGRPIELTNPNTIKFETQMFREDVSLLTANKGTFLDIYFDWKKTKIIGKGQISSKYFVPATKDSWQKEKKDIDLSDCDKIIVDLEFNDDEKRILELGLTPVDMDDRWFSYCKNNIIHYYRSWTTIELFQGQFQKQKSGNWKITEIFTSKDWDAHEEEKRMTFEDNLKFQIQRMQRIMK